MNNNAYDSSGIFAYNNLKTILYLENSLFLNNTSQTNLITMLYSQTNIKNTNFIDNISQSVNNGITLINSHADFDNITVNFTNHAFIWNNQYQVETCFISLNYQSYLIMQNSFVQYCRGSISAFLYVTGSSVAILKNSTLKYIASESGSVIVASAAQNITVDNVKFLSNSQIDINLQETVGYIYNNYFYQGTL